MKIFREKVLIKIVKFKFSVEISRRLHKIVKSGGPFARDAALVSRGQTTIFAQGRYRFQYKRSARIGSGTVHSSYWCNYHRCGDGCKLITRFGDASF